MVQLQKLFREVRRESEALAWEGTFKAYISMAIKDPKLARFSHARIYDMLQWSGVKDRGNGAHNYHLFDDELFGSTKTIQRLSQIFHAASQIPEERRRILLLMGPPGSGKSTLVNLLKGGLERYSRTDEGALYAIAGCPMQEEPLHLVPKHRRAEFDEAYGLQIEGDLCPRCRYNLKHLYDGDIAKVKVKRIAFSEAEGIGMGSFVATSPEGQNLDRLIGSINVDSLTEDRLDGAGKGFRLDGELEAANRGVMEFIQIFRSDDKFLTVVLGVTQEQIIKLGSFGSVYVDETIIAQSNEAEYNTFVANKESEALLDRLIMLKVPYALQRSEEIKIYRKLLTNGLLSSVHMSPLTLPVVASMAVISRLEDGRRTLGMGRMSLRDKMELYDGRALPTHSKADAASVQEESSNEGMFGLSPRFVINRLADAMSQESECLRPLEALESLVEGLEERAGLTKEERERLPSLLPEVIKSYKDMAVRQVQQAATERFEDLAEGQFKSYIKDAKAVFMGRNKSSISSPRINDQLLRRLEGAINIRDSERESFRKDVYHTHEAMRSNGASPTYKDFPLLNAAIEQLLVPNTKELGLMLDPKQVNLDRLQQRKSIQKRLVSNYGYCDKCAQDLIHFATQTVRNRDVVAVKNGRLVRR